MYPVTLLGVYLIGEFPSPLPGSVSVSCSALTNATNESRPAVRMTNLIGVEIRSLCYDWFDLQAPCALPVYSTQGLNDGGA